MGIKTFFNNIRYLFRYNIKTLYLHDKDGVKHQDLISCLNTVPYMINIVDKPKILNIDDTIDLLISSEKSLARLGDGEFFLIEGNNHPF